MSFVPPRGLLAVLAVVDIAINTSQRPLSAKSLATRYNLAPRYLEPMLQMLVQVGILRGIRGPHGGYRLAKPPSELTVEQIFRAAHASATDPHPFLGRNPLIAKVIEPSLEGASHTFSTALSAVTIEALAGRATTLGLVRD
jgi:Rrf2 family protein